MVTAQVLIDSREVSLNPFVRELVANVTVGLLASLKVKEGWKVCEARVSGESLELRLDGEQVPFSNQFVRTVSASVMGAVLKNLRGTEPGSVVIVRVSR